MSRICLSICSSIFIVGSIVLLCISFFSIPEKLHHMLECTVINSELDPIIISGWNAPTTVTYTYILTVNCSINGTYWQGSITKTDEKRDDKYVDGSAVTVYYNDCPPPPLNIIKKNNCRLGNNNDPDASRRGGLMALYFIVGAVSILIYSAINTPRTTKFDKLVEVIDDSTKIKENV
jgi:hypothetical protein